MNSTVGDYQVGIGEAAKARRLKKEADAAAAAAAAAKSAAKAANAVSTAAAAATARAAMAAPAAANPTPVAPLVAANSNQHSGKRQGNRRPTASATHTAKKVVVPATRAAANNAPAVTVATTTGSVVAPVLSRSYASVLKGPAKSATRAPALVPNTTKAPTATRSAATSAVVAVAKRSRVNKKANRKASAPATANSVIATADHTVVGALANAGGGSAANTVAGPTAAPAASPVQPRNLKKPKPTSAATQPKKTKATAVVVAQTDTADAATTPGPLTPAVSLNRPTGGTRKSEKKSSQPSSSTSSTSQNSRRQTNGTRSNKQSSRTGNLSSNSPIISSSSRKVPGAALLHKNLRNPPLPRVPPQNAQPSTSDTNAPNEIRTKEDVYKALPSKFRNGHLVRIGSKKWIHVFSQIEKFFDKGDSEIKVFPDGRNFKEDIADFKHVVLFENKEGLELHIPDDLDFDTVSAYVGTGKVRLSVICSEDGGRHQQLRIGDLVKRFKLPKGKRPHILNILSLESDQAGTKIAKKIVVPKFVKANSLVNRLERVLKERQEQIQAALEMVQEEGKKKELDDQLSEIERIKDSMPRYQKFLLLSMEDSFTDIHIDFSATSVFYHVKKGKKIFYVAPPTPDNIRIYKVFEEGNNPDDQWIGAELFDQWKRVEIKAGQTALIPSGWLHFVFTPEDSIVVGGNFLMEQHLKQQFDLTKLEERCVKDERNSLTYAHTFRGFRNVMWGTLKYLLIPEFTAAPNQDLFEKIETCLANLDVNQEIEEDWFEKEEKAEIKSKAEAVLNSWAQHLVDQQVQGNAENQPSGGRRNKKRPATCAAGNGSKKKARFG